MIKEIPVRGFLSYVHADNEVFGGVADALKFALEGHFEAATGRELNLFLDHDSIGWGENWRERISSSVEAATIFIPIITLRYFDSEACRQELLAYYETAERLGVPLLILPVVIAGAAKISGTDERLEVRLVEELQYRNIEDAVAAGFESAEWRNQIRWMVQQLEARLVEAESTLASRDEAASSTASEVGSDADADAEADFDLATATERMTTFNETVEEAGRALERFGADAGQAFEKAAPTSPKGQRLYFIAAAERIRDSAAELGSIGRQMEAEASRIDGDLRYLLSELDELEVEAAREQRDSLRESLRGLDGVAAGAAQLSEVMEIMRFAAMANVSLRQALTPAIEGISSMNSAADIVGRWRQM